MVDVDEPIHVVPYEPAWVVLAAELVEQIRAGLCGLPVDVEHVGSTAVPGLDAKPVLDVQVGCEHRDVAAVVERVRRLGFEHLSHAGVPGREYLRRRCGGAAEANVHVVERGGRLWADNILFRDHLRAYPEAAAHYGSAKRDAALATGRLLEYSALKASVVSEIMSAARNAAATSGQSAPQTSER
jgi:GrpB-like predicted nucleotidyltransferase (UPF0157 family)